MISIGYSATAECVFAIAQRPVSLYRKRIQFSTQHLSLLLRVPWVPPRVHSTLTERINETLPCVGLAIRAWVPCVPPRVHSTLTERINETLPCVGLAIRACFKWFLCCCFAFRSWAALFPYLFIYLFYFIISCKFNF